MYTPNEITPKFKKLEQLAGQLISAKIFENNSAREKKDKGASKIAMDIEMKKQNEIWHTMVSRTIPHISDVHHNRESFKKEKAEKANITWSVRVLGTIQRKLYNKENLCRKRNIWNSLT